jgi:hypothetical protein
MQQQRSLRRYHPIEFSGRPDRDSVIEKDEILSLRIDFEVLSVEQLWLKYFYIDLP